MNTYEAFKILDLNYYATEYELKQKYKELVKQYHPDVCSWDSTAYFQKINNAYEVALDFASKNNRAPQPPVKTGSKPVKKGSKKTSEYTRKSPSADKNKKSLSNLMMWLIIGGVALVLLLMLIPALQLIVLFLILYGVTRIL